MQTLREVEVTPPITMGMVVVANVLDSGIDILASRDMQVKG
jgi:CxxC motif-containing protein